MTSDESPTHSFRQAYATLQRHAETLRHQDEPNIDELLDIVNESVQAYKVCKQRIDAVEKALEKALDDSSLPPQPSLTDAPDTDATDDDIPF